MKIKWEGEHSDWQSGGEYFACVRVRSVTLDLTQPWFCFIIVWASGPTQACLPIPSLHPSIPPSLHPSIPPPLHLSIPSSILHTNCLRTWLHRTALHHPRAWLTPFLNSLTHTLTHTHTHTHTHSHTHTHTPPFSPVTDSSSPAHRCPGSIN